MKIKAKNIFTILFLLCVSTIHAAKPLSEQAQINFLIGAPNNTSVFSIFGHASLRVNDPELGIDYIFNYGVFDNSNVENILQLIKGNLYCELWVYDTKSYLEKSRQAGIEQKEHVLNLLPEEKETLWEQLIDMGKNKKKYKYDIFRTNCATLPLMSVGLSVAGKIQFDDTVDWPRGSYSSFTKPYLEIYPWPHFLGFLFFGGSIYQPLSFTETLFLPYYLEAAFERAEIVSETGNRPLIVSSSTIVEGRPLILAPAFLTPMLVGWSLFGLVLLLSLWEWKKKRYFRLIDCILFGAAGLFGLLLFLLNTVFAEWYTTFNYNLIWLHPLHLLAVLFFARKKWDKPAYYYHWFNLATLALGAILVLNLGISTKLITVTASYMLILATRSIFGLIRTSKNKK